MRKFRDVPKLKWPSIISSCLNFYRHLFAICLSVGRLIHMLMFTILDMNCSHLLCKVRQVSENWLILGVKNLRNLHKTKEKKSRKLKQKLQNKENVTSPNLNFLASIYSYFRRKLVRETESCQQASKYRRESKENSL